MDATRRPPSIFKRARATRVRPRSVKATCRSSSMATPSTWCKDRRGSCVFEQWVKRAGWCSVDDDRVAHAELFVQEVAAMGLVDSRARDERDHLGLIRAKLDFPLWRGAGGDSRRAEEGGGREVMAAAGAVPE